MNRHTRIGSLAVRHGLVAVALAALAACSISAGDDKEEDEDIDPPVFVISPIKADTSYVPAETMTLAGFMGTGTVEPARAIAGARVTVTVGGTPVAVTDANGITGDSVTTASDGSYLLQFSAPDDAQKTVVVTGTGSDPTPEPATKGRQFKLDSDSQIVLRSIVGSYARLSSVAGTDGKVVAIESSRVNLTQFSTAEAVLAEEANGGPIVSEAQLDASLPQIDAAQLQNLAAAIALVIDDPDYPLPAGVTDTLALAQSPTDRAQVIADANANGDLSATAAASTLAGSWEVIGEIDAARVLRPFGAHVAVVSFFADGKFMSAGFNNDPECTEDVAGTVLEAETEANGNGWERGDYVVDRSSGRLLLSNVTETDGSCGLSETQFAEYQNPQYLSFGSGLSPSVAGVQNGDLLIQYNSDPLDPAQRDPEFVVLRRVASVANSIVGGWRYETPGVADPDVPDPLAMTYFFSDGMAWDIEAEIDVNAPVGCQGSGYTRFTYGFDDNNVTTNSISFESYGNDSAGVPCGERDNEPPFITELRFPSAIHFDFATDPDIGADKITAP